MNAPNPYDLFLNLWSKSMYDEEAGVRPGTEEWDKFKKFQFTQWTKVWADCKELCAHIQKYEDMVSAYNESLRQDISK